MGLGEILANQGMEGAVTNFKRFLVILVSGMCCLWFASPANAQCQSPNMISHGSSAVAASVPSNYGVYEWDEALQAWVQLSAGYHPFFETAGATSWDHHVVPVPVGGGPGDPGDPGGGAQQPQHGQPEFDAGILCSGVGDPIDGSRVTVTGLRPATFGSLQTLIWRGQLLGGHAQRALTGGITSNPAALPAPDRVSPITCADDPIVREAAGQQAAAHYGVRPIGSRGRRVTIRYSTGTTETYQVTGEVGSRWVSAVPGTCRDSTS